MTLSSLRALAAVGWVVVATGCAPTRVVHVPAGSLDGVNAALVGQTVAVVFFESGVARTAEARAVTVGPDTTRWADARTDAPATAPTADVVEVTSSRRGGALRGAAAGAGASVGVAFGALLVAAASGDEGLGPALLTVAALLTAPVYGGIGAVVGSHADPAERVVYYQAPLSQYRAASE